MCDMAYWVLRVLFCHSVNLSFRSLGVQSLGDFAKDLISLLHKIYDTYMKLYQKVKYFLES